MAFLFGAILMVRFDSSMNVFSLCIDMTVKGKSKTISFAKSKTTLAAKKKLSMSSGNWFTLLETGPVPGDEN